jgi:Jacalin-like lectin domain
VKEPITRIIGTYGYSPDSQWSGITYLEFSGSTHNYGSIGKKVGLLFTFESDSGFTGFHGRAYSDSGITALGVYVNCSAEKVSFNK